MKEVVTTNDPIALTAYQAVLRQAGIACFVFDVHTSILEGSLGVLPRRVMVDADDLRRAQRVLADYHRDLEDGRQEALGPETGDPETRDPDTGVHVRGGDARNGG